MSSLFLELPKLVTDDGAFLGQGHNLGNLVSEIFQAGHTLQGLTHN